MRFRRWLLAAAALGFTTGCAGSTNTASAAAPGALKGPALEPLFWQHWSDGLAELSGYDLVQPRYGELRHGRAVAIYVTEPYSRSKRVKVDQYDAQNPDHVTVLKLNLVKKFQTGVYDYSLMTSVFSVPEEGFMPLEVTFSSQEWCGHVFDEVHRTADGLTLNVNSYFEGESQSDRVAAAGVMPEDALFITLRGLGAGGLASADSDAQLLPSATYRRLAHKPARAFGARLDWADAPSAVEVPAGKIDARRVSWNRADDVVCSADVEVAYPHRIVQWQCADGEVAKLTGTARLPYWKTHAEGDEKLLQGLGLGVPRLMP
jgi:hypothetical protein